MKSTKGKCITSKHGKAKVCVCVCVCTMYMCPFSPYGTCVCVRVCWLGERINLPWQWLSLPVSPTVRGPTGQKDHKYTILQKFIICRLIFANASFCKKSYSQGDISTDICIAQKCSQSNVRGANLVFFIGEAYETELDEEKRRLALLTVVALLLFHQLLHLLLHLLLLLLLHLLHQTQLPKRKWSLLGT